MGRLGHTTARNKERDETGTKTAYVHKKDYLLNISMTIKKERKIVGARKRNKRI